MNKEDNLQIAVANYLRYQYPKVLFCHIANERQTSTQRGAKLKKMGVKRGMPDLMIYQTKIEMAASAPPLLTVRAGLAIELKIKPNRPSKEQINVLADLKEQKWETDICYSFDEAQKVIDNYLS